MSTEDWLNRNDRAGARLLDDYNRLEREFRLTTQCLSDSFARENRYAEQAKRYENALGQIAGGDFQDDGSAACGIARTALNGSAKP